MKMLTIKTLNNFLKDIPGFEVKNGRKEKKYIRFNVRLFSTWSTESACNLLKIRKIENYHYESYIQEWIDNNHYDWVCHVVRKPNGNTYVYFNERQI